MRRVGKLLLALWPFLLFGVLYVSMGLFPNYRVNAIDVRGLYEAELHWFGVSTPMGLLTPSAWWALHTHPLLDLLAGVFYLCWVPVPIAFGVWLYFVKGRAWCTRFACAFLCVNVLGFVGYYLHPAAPPWYVMQHGFEAQVGTPGNVAGLGRFDALTGIPVFHALYGHNANVFAAVPSLHAAYLVVTLAYAWMNRCRRLCVVFAVLMVGIWWSAVYSAHHYIIDVLLGVACAVLGVAVFECAVRRLPPVH